MVVDVTTSVLLYRKHSTAIVSRADTAQHHNKKPCAYYVTSHHCLVAFASDLITSRILFSSQWHCMCIASTLFECIQKDLLLYSTFVTVHEIPFHPWRRHILLRALFYRFCYTDTVYLSICKHIVVVFSKFSQLRYNWVFLLFAYYALSLSSYNIPICITRCSAELQRLSFTTLSSFYVDEEEEGRIDQ